MRAKANFDRTTRKKIVKLYSEGLTMQDISSETGIKVLWVMDILRDAGMDLRKFF